MCLFVDVDVCCLTRIEITEESKIRLSEILFPLYIIVAIHIVILTVVFSISILLMLITDDKNIFNEILEILPMIGLIEIILGTLSQLGKTGCGNVSRKTQIWGGHIQMRELEESIDRQVQQIKKRKSSPRSRWKYSDLYMILIGFVLLLLSAMLLEISKI